MKRYLFLPIFCFCVVSCSSTPEKEPSESHSSETESKETAIEDVEEAICNGLNSFVPEGWKIVNNEKGDLNKDGISDVALVIQKTDASMIKKMSGEIRDTNPRNLIVLFGTENKGCYELVVRNSTFILANDNEGMTEPFENMGIENGTLRLYFSEFHSVGNWMSGQYTYIWRFQDGDFKLIGASADRYHRADGDATDVSVNFSTKKYSVTTYNMFDESVEEEVVWKTLDLKKLKTFESFKAPWTLTINSDIYL